MTKKINLRGIQSVGSPTPNMSFCTFFRIFQKYFSKKFKKNALDIIRVLFKDKSITIDIIPQLNFFPLLFTGCHAFLQKQRFAKTRPKLEYILL